VLVARHSYIEQRGYLWEEEIIRQDSSCGGMSVAFLAGLVISGEGQLSEASIETLDAITSSITSQL